MKSPLFAVYGAGGRGRGIMPLARAQLRGCGDITERLVFIDDAPLASIVNGQRVLNYEDFMASEASERHVVLAIADGFVRERLAAQCAADGIHPWTVVASNVVMMDDDVIGEGSVLGPFVTLTSNVRIGRHFQANPYSYIEHDCVIGDFVTFGPGVHCNGNTLIEDHVHIGAGAIIKQGQPGSPIVIGYGATIEVGAVITQSVPPQTLVESDSPPPHTDEGLPPSPPHGTTNQRS